MAAHGDVRAVGSFFFALVSGGDGSRLSVVRGGQPTGSGRLDPRFALVSNKDRGYDGGLPCFRIGEPLRSLSAARRLLMGREVGAFEAGWSSRQTDGWCQPTRSVLRSRRR